MKYCSTLIGLKRLKLNSQLASRMAQSVSETESSRRLTLSSLATVRDALYDVRSKWEDIGIELLSKNDTDAIKKEKGNNVGDCLTETLSMYLKRANPEPSWSSIITALKVRAVGESQLAQDLEQKYMNQTATLLKQQNVEPAQIDRQCNNNNNSIDREALQQSLSPDQEDELSIIPSFPYLDTNKLSPHEREDLIQRLSKDYTNILANFAKLQTSTCESLCRQNISAEKIANCALTLALYKSDDVPMALPTKEQESLEEARTVDRIFILLRRYNLISYFNYGILKHIIETYGTEDDKSKLRKYVDEFQKFCQHKVVEVPPVISECTSSTRKIFKVLITADIRATLIDIAAAERRIADILGLTHSVLTLHEITPGSLVLTLSIPILIADKIFPLQVKQLSQLKANGFTILSGKITMGQLHTNYQQI